MERHLGSTAVVPRSVHGVRGDVERRSVIGCPWPLVVVHRNGLVCQANVHVRLSLFFVDLRSCYDSWGGKDGRWGSWGWRCYVLHVDPLLGKGCPVHIVQVLVSRLVHVHFRGDTFLYGTGWIFSKDEKKEELVMSTYVMSAREITNVRGRQENYKSPGMILWLNGTTSLVYLTCR